MYLFLKRFLPALLFIFTAAFAIAQDSTHVKWKTSFRQISDKQYQIILQGTIDPGWHMYAKANAEAELFGIVISYEDSSIKQETFQLKAEMNQITDPIFDNIKNEVVKSEVDISQQITFTNDPPSSLRIQLNYDVADNESFLPEEQKINIVFDANAKPIAQNRLLIPSINIEKPLADCGDSSAVNRTAESSGLLNLFLLGFAGGLIALLTPCVFPMIPLTVSFFTKKSGSKQSGIRNAFIYGFFIFLIYILLSLPFHFHRKIYK